MAIIPINDTVFGDVIEVDEQVELRTEFLALTEAANLGGYQFEAARRQVEAALSPKKQAFQVRVFATGPDCKELRPGDIAILPEGGGSMITIIDDETDTFRRVFAIAEKGVLACFRDDDDAS